MPYCTYCKRDNFDCSCLDTSLLSRHVHLWSSEVKLVRSSPSDSQSLSIQANKAWMQQVRRFDWYLFRHFRVMPPFCRISSVPPTFLESVTRKASTVKDDESPCVNPPRNSFSGFRQLYHICFTTSLAITKFFPPARARVLSLGYVTELQWRTALRTTGTCERSWFNYTPSWDSLVATEKHLTLWHYDLMCVTSLVSFAICIHLAWEWWLKSIVNLRRLKKWVAHVCYAQVSEECCVPLILLRETRVAW
jgi:hypothetical protein